MEELWTLNNWQHKGIIFLIRYDGNVDIFKSFEFLDLLTKILTNG